MCFIICLFIYISIYFLANILFSFFNYLHTYLFIYFTSVFLYCRLVHVVALVDGLPVIVFFGGSCCHHYLTWCHKVHITGLYVGNINIHGEICSLRYSPVNTRWPWRMLLSTHHVSLGVFSVGHCTWAHPSGICKCSYKSNIHGNRGQAWH